MKIDVGFDRKLDKKKYDRIWRRMYNKLTGNVKRKLADYKYMDKRDKRSTICDYMYDELLYVLSTNRCHYCGSTKHLTLDRIDNTKGHTKDNTIVACLSCNTIRGNDYTVEEMEAVKPLLDQMINIRNEIDVTLRNLHKNTDQ